MEINMEINESPPITCVKPAEWCQINNSKPPQHKKNTKNLIFTGGHTLEEMYKRHMAMAFRTTAAGGGGNTSLRPHRPPGLAGITMKP